MTLMMSQDCLSVGHPVCSAPLWLAMSSVRYGDAGRCTVPVSPTQAALLHQPSPCEALLEGCESLGSVNCDVQLLPVIRLLHSTLGKLVREAASAPCTALRV